MHFNTKTCLLAAAALAPLAAAKPIKVDISDINDALEEFGNDVEASIETLGKFSFSQVASRTKRKDGARAIQKAFAKFGATAPSYTISATNAYVTGSAITRPEDDDIEFLTEVTCGDQTLELDIDTGSSDL